MKPIVAALAVGAAARLTRLVARDSILDIPRERFEHWANTRKHGENYTIEQAENDPHWAVILVNCPWCIGFWINAATLATAARWGDRRWWRAGTTLLATSFATSALVAITD